MRQMFASATLQLTAWYLLVIMVVSLLFSGLIFELSTNEISSRLEQFQIRLEGGQTLVLPGTTTLNEVRIHQTREAKVSIFFGLLYMNLSVLGIGGIVSFLLARRTLRPIEAAHEAQSRFTSDASHELKTPLAIMKSEIQVALRDKNITPKELRQTLESNLEEVDKLAGLSQTLLQLSRLDYSDISRGERVNLTAILTSAIATFSSERKRKITFRHPKNAVVMDGNITMIGDLVAILLDNALKYSPADTAVSVALSSNGRTARLAVSNEGPGINPEDLPHIFKRFYRADRSRTSHQTTKSYGLGLSLARKIVELHDGQIQASSTPGRLTTFRVSLPHVRKNR